VEADEPAGEDAADEAADEAAEDGEETGEDEEYERAPLLSFSNTDMAFAGDVLVAGSYHGFNVYRLQDDGAPALKSSIVCPGGQGDVSIVGDLLIMSVEETRGRVDCGLDGVSEDTSPERFRGIRIFNIRTRIPLLPARATTARSSFTTRARPRFVRKRSLLAASMSPRAMTARRYSASTLSRSRSMIRRGRASSTALPCLPTRKQAYSRACGAAVITATTRRRRTGRTSATTSRSFPSAELQPELARVTVFCSTSPTR
jgi:hypothetical protein